MSNRPLYLGASAGKMCPSFNSPNAILFLTSVFYRAFAYLAQIWVKLRPALLAAAAAAGMIPNSALAGISVMSVVC